MTPTYLSRWYGHLCCRQAIPANAGPRCKLELLCDLSEPLRWLERPRVEYSEARYVGGRMPRSALLEQVESEGLGLSTGDALVLRLDSMAKAELEAAGG